MLDAETINKSCVTESIVSRSPEVSLGNFDLKHPQFTFLIDRENCPGGVLPSNRLMGMCRWMGSHFHDWINYNGVAFSSGANRVTRMGSHICGISGVSIFRQVGIWGIFAQK